MVFQMSFMFYLFFIALMSFLIFYVWRRLYGLEKYTQVLERKCNNLKKENKELQELLKNPDTTDFSSADDVMNKIFGVEKCCDMMENKCNINIMECKFQDKPDVEIKEISKTTEIKKEKPMNEVKLEQERNTVPKKLDEIDEITDLISPVLPIAEHKESEEIESVISDSNVYNKKKLNKMNLDKIKEICVSMNISTDGTKNVLIDKILAQ